MTEVGLVIPGSLMKAKQVAEYLNISMRTLIRLRDEGYLLPVRVGRSYRYRPEDVEEFLENGTVSSEE